MIIVTFSFPKCEVKNSIITPHNSTALKIGDRKIKIGANVKAAVHNLHCDCVNGFFFKLSSVNQVKDIQYAHTKFFTSAPEKFTVKMCGNGFYKTICMCAVYAVENREEKSQLFI